MVYGPNFTQCACTEDTLSPFCYNELLVLYNQTNQESKQNTIFYQLISFATKMFNEKQVYI